MIAGPAEAIVGLGSADAPTRRARTERGSRRSSRTAERLLEAARARLANDAFTSKAPAAVVEGARAREAELPTRPSACATGSTLSGATRSTAVAGPSPRSPCAPRGRCYDLPIRPPRHGGRRAARIPEASRGDADQASQAATAKVAPGLPEEVVAQEYQLKLHYARARPARASA